MRRTRVYIAGPISKGDVLHNVDQATAAFAALATAGYAPFCPQWSVYSKPACLRDGGVWCEATTCGNTEMGHADWMGVDLPWVAVSDAVLRLPGDSEGADLETSLAIKLGVPVFDSLEVLVSTLPKSRWDGTGGHPGFLAGLKEIEALHCRKAADYGTDADPFANVRASQEFGVPAWLGAVLRGNDKMTRLKTFAQKGSLANEGVEDSLLDLAAYAIIALALFREQSRSE